MRQGDSASDRLARAKVLARLAPGESESALVLARAALEARDFKLARQAMSDVFNNGRRPTARMCLTMADIEETEHGPSGRMREWLARAARAARDPVWIADGIVSDEWLPASPLNGRLDAFKWEVPVERIGHRQDEAAPPIFSPIEPELAPAAGPVPLELEPLELAPPEVVVIAQETPPAAEEPAQAPELAQKLAPEIAIEEKPAAEQAPVIAAGLTNAPAPGSEPAPARLVSLKSLPKGLVTAPDDPGPDAPDPLAPPQTPPPPRR